METDEAFNLPIKLKKLLDKANLATAADVLKTSNFAFKKLGVSNEEIELIKKFFARNAFGGFISVDAIIDRFPAKWKRISFGCSNLDKLTQNGIPTQGITEISGEAGAGKSQLCLQLSLTVQLPESLGGLQKGAVFICTEDNFPSNRLHQMIAYFGKRYKDKIVNIQFSSNIFIQHIADVDHLLSCVCNQLENVINQQNIGLVVIDSVGAIFRSEPNIISRADDMRNLVEKLLNLSNKYNCAILCVNQVSSVIDDSGMNKLVPCLGLAWANLVNTRIQIYRTNKSFSHKVISDCDNSTSSIVRQMKIVYSSELPPKSAEFLISSDGVIDMPEVNL